MKKCAAYVHNPGYYSACLLLNIESHVITRCSEVIKPFNKHYDIQVAFDENTFPDHQTTVDFKVSSNFVLQIL